MQSWCRIGHPMDWHLWWIVAIRSGWKLVGRIPWNVHLSAKHSRSLVWWENTIRETFWETIYKVPIIPFGSLVEYHPITAKDQSRIHQFGKKGHLDCSLDTFWTRCQFERVTFWLQTLRTWKRWTHQKSTPLNEKEVIFHEESGKYSSCRWTNQTSRRRSGPENIHLETGTLNSSRRSRWFSWRIRRVSSTTSRLTSECQWCNKWLLVTCQETSYTTITLNLESNLTRREN